MLFWIFTPGSTFRKMYDYVPGKAVGSIMGWQEWVVVAEIQSGFMVKVSFRSGILRESNLFRGNTTCSNEMHLRGKLTDAVAPFLIAIVVVRRGAPGFKAPQFWTDQTAAVFLVVEQERKHAVCSTWISAPWSDCKWRCVFLLARFALYEFLDFPL